jgi:parallel beta-helix repeat protein
MRGATIHFRCWWILLFLFSTASIPTSGKVIYVDDDATGANNGSSWKNAYTSLQDALTDANNAVKLVEIRVAQGTYKPDRGARQTLGDRSATFRLLNDVTLSGGFAGFSAIDPNERDNIKYETILSGDLKNNDIEVDPCDLENEPTRSDNTFSIVTGNNTNKTAVIDGFTIIGGFGTKFDVEFPRNIMTGIYFNFRGGGSINQFGSPTITNCTFKRNNGGGIYNYTSSSPEITNCTFSENSAYYGGGIYNYSNSIPTITNCLFNKNSAHKGGGIYNEFNCNTIITDNVFIENTASDGGGIYNSSKSSTINSCTFFGNVVKRYGGGIYNISCIGSTIINCIFMKNAASYGGAMLNSDGSLTMTNCTLIENSTDQHGLGGGMLNYDNDANLINCKFIGNSATYGGGIFNQNDCNLKFANCIFARNTSDYGGGIHNEKNNIILLQNCTFTGNVSSRGNVIDTGWFSQINNSPNIVELYNCILWDEGYEIWNANKSKLTIAYTDIKGGKTNIYDPNQDIIWGTGNIAADPCFAEDIYWDPNGTSYPFTDDIWIDGDYHLKSQAGRWDPNIHSWVIDDVTSPCIDAGDPITPIGYETYPHGSRINMGAYGGTIEASRSLNGAGNYFQESSNPNPANGEIDVALDIMPIWISNPNAVMHEVYFGKSETPAFIGKQSERGFDPGVLEPNTRYYWRVDDIDSLCNRSVGNTWTFITGHIPAYAYKPTPINGAGDVDFRMTLTWIPGLNAVAHNVYLGTNFNDVFRASIINPSGVLVSVAQEPNYFDLIRLDCNQTYYWRIDEIDALGMTTIGNIWMFTTKDIPAYAYNPIPWDGELSIEIDTILSWSPGLNAISHDIYLGTNYIYVSNANIINPQGVLFAASQKNNYINTGQLKFNQTYYWRIDEIDGQGKVISGDIWTFTTTSQPAFNPNPPNSSINVKVDTLLSWSPGSSALKHNVYFGTDFNDVNEATNTNSLGVFVSSGQTFNFYNPGTLKGSQRYYWRIDEVDNKNIITTGDVWSFTTETPPKGRACFTGQTPVWIGDSLESISTAVIGNSVGGIGTIEKVQEHEGVFTLYDIILESGNCITVAENHYFLTESGEWTSLHDLKAGARLKTFQGSIGIRSITKQPLPYTGKVYNLEIQGSDQYMVGDDAIIARDY